MTFIRNNYIFSEINQNLIQSTLILMAGATIGSEGVYRIRVSLQFYGQDISHPYVNVSSYLFINSSVVSLGVTRITNEDVSIEEYNTINISWIGQLALDTEVSVRSIATLDDIVVGEGSWMIEKVSDAYEL